MDKFTRKLLSGILLISASGAISIGSALAQDLPISALTSYSAFRASLLRYGWTPDNGYGVRNQDGTPMYRYPEVICGNSLCTAQWIARNGKKMNIVLWRDSAGDYRVAPHMDWPEPNRQ